MAWLYADEQFPYRVTELLRELGHDVLTVQEAGNRGLDDDQVLEFATHCRRAVLTLNRRHFIRLHSQRPDHAGIIACKDDSDRERIAMKINETIICLETLSAKLIRINRQE